MAVYLVRHGKAGSRASWEGDDRRRPLTRRGQRQAEGLCRLLEYEAFEHVVSSPYVRCLQTVVPLASRRGCAIESSDALAEGASLEDALALVRKHTYKGAVLCTHGDVVPMLLGHFQSLGVPLRDPRQWPKGSAWVLDCEAGEVVGATYLAPPPDDAPRRDGPP